MSVSSEVRNTSSQTFEMLDGIDLRIIHELQDDARLRIAELGRRVGLSPPAVAERMRRLEDCGVLAFRAEVNPRALGYAIAAIVRVSPLGGHVHAIPDIARQTPEVTECYRITGEDCFFMKLYLRSIEDLEPILDRFTAHGRTTTSIVHSVPVRPRPLPATAS
jgi:Lrp/AsnC family transcriptional regulator, leucine-responsive regulatory protein